MAREPGLSVRLKLTLSYAGFLMLAVFLMLVAVWLAGPPGRTYGFVLRHVPDEVISLLGAVVPGRHAFLLRAVAPGAAIAVAFLLVFGLVGGWILAGRMLAPLIRITEATRAATKGSLSHRIRLPGRRDEFRELADAFDTMLERLEAHVGEQRRFAANASHELRTPLAITQTLLDVARTRSGPRRRRRWSIASTSSTPGRSTLTEALLLLSRADQRTFTREHVDLSLLAEEAAETLLPLAEKRGLSIETSGDPALRHRVSCAPAAADDEPRAQRDRPQPASTRHRVGHDQRRPEAALLTVENTGETLAPERDVHARRAVSAWHRAHTHR